MNKSYDLIGLGYCGLDHLCLVPRIPVDDKVEAPVSLTQGGGPAATATYAAAKLGAKTAFIGATGDDDRGLAIMDGLRNGGVDIAAMVTRSGVESPAAFCWTEEPTGHRSIVWTRGGVKPLLPEEINFEIIKSTRLLHLDGHQTAAVVCAAKPCMGCIFTTLWPSVRMMRQPPTAVPAAIVRAHTTLIHA